MSGCLREAERILLCESDKCVRRDVLVIYARRTQEGALWRCVCVCVCAHACGHMASVFNNV